MKQKQPEAGDGGRRRCRICTLAYAEKWSSEEEHRADALALGADEGRDKLRKAAGRSTYPVSRGCLNGETRQERSCQLYMNL